ncbi:MAG: capsule assembly Wzi family protein [Woeseiaceae bacterium]|nr:capsule assembly Wzi family protein [Woeseiaceae bacterium]
MTESSPVGARHAGDPGRRSSTAPKPVQNTTSSCSVFLFLALASLVFARTAVAGPYIEPGDVALRHDIQLLADHGVIRGPVTTWPLAWGPILEALRDADATELSPMLADAYSRVRTRARWETRTNEVRFDTSLAVAEEPTRIRSFQNTPRGDVQLTAGADWTGDWLSLDLNVQALDSDQDSSDARADNSMIGVAAGNWTIAASTQDRWWGPGWDGSLILSNNARPIPSLMIDRIFTDPFETKWLSWIGPWDMTILFGQLESEREVPDARFFGMRVNFRPTESLEIGLSRTALWCGEDRPCGFDTFVDLYFGRDNLGDAGVTEENEPGTQEAGFDIRWSPAYFDRNVAFYGQFIGEDEAGGLPSKWFGQFGAEWSGVLRERWSARAFLELAATSCQFQENSEIFNCAYNHSIYKTGFRYRGRTIGHPADNDARLVSSGLSLVDSDGTAWYALLRAGPLNRADLPDARNSLTPLRQDIVSIDVTHVRPTAFGTVAAGIGYERVDDEASGRTDDDARFFVEWRSGF